MKKTILAALTGGALALAGCSSAAPSTPAPQQAAGAESEAPPAEDETAQEELREAAAEELGEAYDEFVISYNDGITNGDDVMEEDPSASLDGFSQQRDALYEFDAALREIEFPDEMVEDVNEYLEKLAEHIEVLDQINEAETVGELDTLYEVDLAEARDEEIAALDPILEELGITLEEEEDEAPTIGGGGSGGNDSDPGSSSSGVGDGGELIEDAGVVVETLQDAISLGTAPNTQLAFPEEWLPYTERWTFAGSAIPPDQYSISGNTIVYSKEAGMYYMLSVVKDWGERCYAVLVNYGPNGESSTTASSKRILGECTHQGAYEEMVLY